MVLQAQARPLLPLHCSSLVRHADKGGFARVPVVAVELLVLTLLFRERRVLGIRLVLKKREELGPDPVEQPGFAVSDLRGDKLVDFSLNVDQRNLMCLLQALIFFLQVRLNLLLICEEEGEELLVLLTLIALETVRSFLHALEELGLFRHAFLERQLGNQGFLDPALDFFFETVLGVSYQVLKLVQQGL